MTMRVHIGEEAREGRFHMKGSVSLNQDFCPVGSPRPCITVCSCGAECKRGSDKLKDALIKEARRVGVDLEIGEMKTACSGNCSDGPFVGFPHKSIFYYRVEENRAKDIILETMIGGRVLFDLLYLTPSRSYRSDVIFNKDDELLLTIDESLCMVKLSEYFLKFEDGLSCGKCVPCRQGNVRLRKIISKIIEGNGEEGDVGELKAVCDVMRLAAYCEFAKTTSMPLMLAIKHFEGEFIDHVVNKRCVAGECPSLRRKSKVVDDDKEAVAA